MWPEEKWKQPRKFFDMAYHTLFFLDYYLTNPPDTFAPPLSYTLLKEFPEDRIDDIFPERIFTKREMLDFLDACRRKCKLVIGNITEENVQIRWVEQDSPRNYLMIELLMYNMRLVQHHAAQMNIMLRNDYSFANQSLHFIIVVPEDFE